MNRTLIATIPAATFLLTCLASGTARAQVPFFGAGASIFDPEISTVQSGVLLDVQATVSADRKYVTMTMRPQQAQLLSLQEFTFQRGFGGAVGQGFVGGVGMGNGSDDGGEANANGGSGSRSGGRSASTSAASNPPRAPTVLDQPGMTLLGRAPEPLPARRRS